MSVCVECGIEFDPWQDLAYGELCDYCDPGIDLDQWSPDDGEFPE